jgi:zinc transporter ZupT
MKLPFLSEEESWALTLTTFAGLSTSVGAVFAVSAPRSAGQGCLVPATGKAVRRTARLVAAFSIVCCPVQVIKQPDDALLAFLLGNAIGVMVLLSVAEM